MNNLIKPTPLQRTFQTSFIAGFSGLVSYYLYSSLNVHNKDNKDNKDNKENEQLILMNNQEFYADVVQYIYIKYESEIKQFTYHEEMVNNYNEWRYRGSKDDTFSMKVLSPLNTTFTVKYNGGPISIDISQILDDKIPFKIMEVDRMASKESFVQKLTLEATNKEVLIQFVDEAREYIKSEYEKQRKSSRETMCVFYYKKDYWVLLSKAPKRPIDTIYLKEGVRDKLIEDVEEFFSPDTRDIYLSYGIPYKSVNMIYGPPGSGKTTTIKGIASVLDCDVYILPITKDTILPL